MKASAASQSTQTFSIFRDSFEKLNKNINAEECISVGDKPPADHAAAKPLGMTTIWQKYGGWKKIVNDTPQYIDFEAKRIKDISRIVKELE